MIAKIDIIDDLFSDQLDNFEGYISKNDSRIPIHADVCKSQLENLG